MGKLAKHKYTEHMQIEVSSSKTSKNLLMLSAYLFFASSIKVSYRWIPYENLNRIKVSVWTKYC